MKSDSGQASIEAVICAILIVLLVTIFCFSCYLGFVRITTNLALHEALVCDITVPLSGHAKNCEKNLKRALEAPLLFQKLERIEWKRRHHFIEVRIGLSTVATPLLNIGKINYKKSIDLPLSTK